MAHCNSCGFEGTPTKGYCPNCRSKMEPGKRKGTFKRSSGKGDAVARGVYWGVIITIMLLLAGMLFYPPMQPYGEKAYDAFMRGLDHYKEVPDFAEFTVTREMSIQAAMDIEYTLFVQRPENIVQPSAAGLPNPDEDDLIQEVLEVEINYEDGGNQPVVLELKSNSLDENGEQFTQINYLFTNNKDTIEENKANSKPLNPSNKATELPAGETQTIEITYHVRSYSLEWSVNKATSGKVEDIPQEYVLTYVNQNDGNEWKVVDNSDEPINVEDLDSETTDYRIEPTNPYISDLAHGLCDGKGTVFEKVEAIYNYLDDNLEYLTLATGEPPKHCVQTLQDGKGDCDDQSIAFISMCRAVGIPAWLVGGVLFDPYIEEWVGHGWAQVLIPLNDGTYVIPTVDVVNDHFLFRDPNRLTDWVDDGMPGSIEDYYSSWSYVYYGSGGQVNIVDEYSPIDYKAEKNDMSIKV